jgi:hypothetical protein
MSARVPSVNAPGVNAESAELRRLYADLGCVYRREAEALKTSPPKEALRRFHVESKKAAAIIGRITEIERTAPN